jgi:hypothetical protein
VNSFPAEPAGRDPGQVTAPSAEDFRALARSSPWRWTTLRFTVRWSLDLHGQQSLRAWLRRPDRLRVETDAGALVQIVRADRQGIAQFTTDGGRPVDMPWAADPGAPVPKLRPDGLVAQRPPSWALSVDDPMYQNYFWVAMLDPVELADGLQEERTVDVPGLDVAEVVAVEHGGRPAWEAVVRTTPDYEPRCGCCSLLRDRRIDELEWDGRNQLAEYPEAYRVRLDVGTGVCVRTEALGGSVAGQGHDLRIEAVDEPMADELFVEPRRGPFRRGWSPRQ